MKYVIKRNIHRPPHIYLDNSIYFVTGRTVNKKICFKNIKIKEIFVEVLNNCLNRFKADIYAWVLLDEHYHLLVRFINSLTAVTPRSSGLSKFINTLHSVSALKINQIDKFPSRKIWYQYWDHCIRNEADFYKHFNYIHQNPIKHGLVKNLDELEKYKFSSYKDWIKKKNKSWLLSCFERYPIKDFVERSEK